MDEKIYDTLIIGSGPAGLTAAIYNVRANLKTLVIGGDQPGGQLTITTTVDNWPGFPSGIGGMKLMMDMQQQVKNLGVEIRNGLVGQLEVTGDKTGKFQAELNDGTKLQAKAVIIATGAKAKWIGVPGEKELIGHGVSGCATCDGMFFRDKIVAVVGGGDTAAEEAVFLSRFASKVYLIHRRDSLRACATEQKHVFDNSKITILWNTEIKEIIGSQKVEKVKLWNNNTNESSELELDGVFVAIGHDPATGFVKEVVQLRDSGQVVTGLNTTYPTMSSVPGIFAAGDCVNEKYQQAIVAAGDGCRAGLDAERWLQDNAI